jgi:hypothetical protein
MFHDCCAVCKVSSPFHNSTDLGQTLTRNINDFLNKRDESFIREVFCRHAKQISELSYRGDKIIFPAGLLCALKDINAHNIQNGDRNFDAEREIKSEDAAALVAALKSENGGLNLKSSRRQ